MMYLGVCLSFIHMHKFTRDGNMLIAVQIVLINSTSTIYSMNKAHYINNLTYIYIGFGIVIEQDIYVLRIKYNVIYLLRLTLFLT